MHIYMRKLETMAFHPRLETIDSFNDKYEECLTMFNGNDQPLKIELERIIQDLVERVFARILKDHQRSIFHFMKLLNANAYPFTIDGCLMWIQSIRIPMSQNTVRPGNPIVINHVQQPKKKNEKLAKCFECGKFGHLRAKCLNLKVKDGEQVTPKQD